MSGSSQSFVVDRVFRLELDDPRYPYEHIEVINLEHAVRILAWYTSGWTVCRLTDCCNGDAYVLARKYICTGPAEGHYEEPVVSKCCSL